MSKDPIDERFQKRKKKDKLDELAHRAMSTEDLEAEEAVIAKAKEERAKDPGKYQIKGHPAIGRNDPCPCGSGKKYKKCCGVTAE